MDDFGRRQALGGGDRHDGEGCTFLEEGTLSCGTRSSGGRGEDRLLEVEDSCRRRQALGGQEIGGMAICHRTAAPAMGWLNGIILENLVVALNHHGHCVPHACVVTVTSHRLSTVAQATLNVKG